MKVSWKTCNGGYRALQEAIRPPSGTNQENGQPTNNSQNALRDWRLWSSSLNLNT